MGNVCLTLGEREIQKKRGRKKSSLALDKFYCSSQLQLKHVPDFKGCQSISNRFGPECCYCFSCSPSDLDENDKFSVEEGCWGN